MKHITTYKLFESTTGRLQVLKDHFDRTNMELANWIIKNIYDPELPDNISNEEEAKQVIKKVDQHKYYRKLPAMYFFDSPAEDVPEDTWLVHFTDYPDDIIKDGFTKGTPDFIKLGMSWGITSQQPGYNYGLTVDDAIEKYGSIEKAAKHWNGKPIYFKAPAIKNYHFGDDVEQVLFWGPDAHSFTKEIYKSDNSNSEISSEIV